MIINVKQSRSFVPHSIGQYVLKVRNYLIITYPEHALIQQIHELDKHINEVIQFAFLHKIKSEINILNLTILFLNRNIPINLSAEQSAILNNQRWSENKRTEEFFLHVLLNN